MPGVFKSLLGCILFLLLTHSHPNIFLQVLNESAEHHFQMHELSTSLFWSLEALRNGLVFSDVLALGLPAIDQEFLEARGIPLPSLARSDPIPTPVRSSNVLLDAFKVFPEISTLQSFNDPAPGNVGETFAHAIRDAVKSLSGNSLSTAVSMVFDHVVRACKLAAQAYHRLGVVTHSLFSGTHYFRSCVLTEFALVSCLVDLIRVENRLDSVLLEAPVFDSLTSFPTLGLCTLMQDVGTPPSHLTPTQANTRSVLSDLCFFYASSLYVSSGTIDIKDRKVQVLQLCENLTQISVAVTEGNLHDAVRFGSHSRLLKSIEEQLQSLNGPAIIINRNSWTGASPSLAASPTTTISITRDQWAEDGPACSLCTSQFGLFVRRHHCRECGRLACGSCCKLYGLSDRTERRVCRSCIVNAAFFH
jgi:hypothetical protein